MEKRAPSTFALQREGGQVAGRRGRALRSLLGLAPSGARRARGLRPLVGNGTALQFGSSARIGRRSSSRWRSQRWPTWTRSGAGLRLQADRFSTSALRRHSTLSNKGSRRGEKPLMTRGSPGSIGARLNVAKPIARPPLRRWYPRTSDRQSRSRPRSADWPES